MKGAILTTGPYSAISAYGAIWTSGQYSAFQSLGPTTSACSTALRSRRRASNTERRYIDHWSI
eukprot:scaffold7519_cov242-Isochrysis_galbana.AAC.1